jgi:ketosteroid isomerase-like protein
MHATARGPREVFARLQATILDDYDMNGQADLFAENGVLEWPFAAPGMPRRIEGREAIREVLLPLGEAARRAGRRLRGYDAVVVHDTTDPQEIVVEFEVEGERADDGEPYRLSYIQVLRVVDGEIALLRDYWNPLALTALLQSPGQLTGSSVE